MYALLLVGVINIVLSCYIIYRLRTIEISREVIVTKTIHEPSPKWTIKEAVVFNTSKTFGEKILETVPTSLSPEEDE